MSVRHVLKVWPQFFRAVWDGDKTFEIRYNDRGYQAGDVVVLREYDGFKQCSCTPGAHPNVTCERFSGREVEADIGYVLGSVPGRKRGEQGWDGHGYVVFSLVDIEKRTKTTPTGSTPSPRQLFGSTA